jgi:hypothetical protein
MGDWSPHHHLHDLLFAEEQRIGFATPSRLGLKERKDVPPVRDCGALALGDRRTGR